MQGAKLLLNILIHKEILINLVDSQIINQKYLFDKPEATKPPFFNNQKVAPLNNKLRCNISKSFVCPIVGQLRQDKTFIFIYRTNGYCYTMLK